MGSGDGVSASAVTVTEKEAEDQPTEEKKQKKVGGAAFGEEKSKRAPSRRNKFLELGEQKLQRVGTTHATSLIATVDPQDPFVKSSCCPRLGRPSASIAGAAPVTDIAASVKMDSVIGSGGFSSIHSGLMAGNSVAIKCVTTSTLQESCLVCMYEAEVKMASQLQHANVVSLLHVFQDHSMLYLVMDDLAGGDLFDRLASSSLAPAVAARYVCQMVSGIAYCHQRKISHRDIRPENYLLTNQSSKAELKLIDFSLARLNEDGANMRTMLGCLHYVAPEVICGKYDKQCDVWSVGVVAFLCCTGRLPIYDAAGESASLVKRVRDADITWDQAASVDPSMLSLLREMLTKDPAVRSSASKLAENEWLLKMGVAGGGGGGCCALL